MDSANEIEVCQLDAQRLHLRHHWIPPLNRRVIYLFGAAGAALLTFPLAEDARSLLIRLCMFAPFGYGVGALARNHTNVVIEDGRLRWHHRPVPWSFGDAFPVSDVSAIVTGAAPDLPTPLYGVSARLHNGKDRVILTCLRNEEEAQLAARKMALLLSVPVLPGPVPYVAPATNHVFRGLVVLLLVTMFLASR